MKLWIFWKHILGTTFSGMLLAFFCFHLHAVQNRILISIQALLLVFFVVFSLSWTFFSLIFLFCPALFSRIISISMSTSFWIAAAAAAKSTQWVAAYQAPPFMGFSRQEYRSGVPLPSPANFSRKWQMQDFHNSSFVYWTCLAVKWSLWTPFSESRV